MQTADVVGTKRDNRERIKMLVIMFGFNFEDIGLKVVSKHTEISKFSLNVHQIHSPAIYLANVHDKTNRFYQVSKAKLFYCLLLF